MPRRNRREGRPQPLDLTPAEVPRQRPRRPGDQPLWRQRMRAQNERAKAQREALFAGGIDWTICLVPGCGESLVFYGRQQHPPGRRDTDHELPLCAHHSVVAWQTVQRQQHRTELLAANQAIADERAQREQQTREADKLENRLNQDGHIYFVRLNGLVKVGWSGDLYARLKSYGASAEILCHYPGTRQDETTLHRQLRPVLAKGREWYHDGDVIRMYIDEAIRKYGPPSITIAWTQPKRPQTKPRNWR